MHRYEMVNYFAQTVIGVFILYATLLWLIAPYFPEYTGVHIGKHGIGGYSVAIISYIVGILLIRLNEDRAINRRRGSFDISPNLAKTMKITGNAAFYFTGLILLLLFFSWPKSIMASIGVGDFITWYTLLALAQSLQKYGQLLTVNLSKQAKAAGPSADDILKSDPRAPVLYLRSFDAESAKSTMKTRFKDQFKKIKENDGGYLFSIKPGYIPVADPMVGSRYSKLRSKRSMFDEQLVFADVFSRIGPYIAIGRPGEVFENMDLGAAKKYVADEEWQDQIIRWLTTSAVVILEADDSSGLMWEMQQVVSRLDPRKLLVILPIDDAGYQIFRERANDIFPKKFPQNRASSRLLIFTSGWEPVELENINLTLGQTLEPFFRQNNLELGVASY